MKAPVGNARVSYSSSPVCSIGHRECGVSIYGSLAMLVWLLGEINGIVSSVESSLYAKILCCTPNDWTPYQRDFNVVMLRFTVVMLRFTVVPRYRQRTIA
jgi:hypothetical protein